MQIVNFTLPAAPRAHVLNMPLGKVLGIRPNLRSLGGVVVIAVPDGSVPAECDVVQLKAGQSEPGFQGGYLGSYVTGGSTIYVFASCYL